MSDIAAEFGAGNVTITPAPTAAAPAPAAAPTAAPAAAPTAAPAAAGEGKETPAPLNVEPPEAPLAPEPPAGNFVVEYQPTGDASLDLALAFVGDRGFGPDRPEMKAATKGDFGPLAESLKKLGDKAKGYERYLKAAQESFNQRTQARAAAESEAEKAVVGAVGGVAAWNAIHAWVVAEASPQEKAEINAAFKASKTAAVAMAEKLAASYRKSGKSTLPAKSALKAEASGGAPSGSEGALSPQQFKDEMKRIVAKYGSRVQYTEEYKSAEQRRRAYRG